MTMESSKYNFVKELHEERSALYYNRWQWCLSWRQSEISVLRDSLDPDNANRLLERRRLWEKTRWDQFGSLSNALRPSYRSAITPDVQRNVHTVRQWLENHKGLYKTVYFNGQINIYTNDKTLVDQGIALCKPFVYGCIRVKQALPTVPVDVIGFKRPHPYTQRTYFKTAKLTDSTINSLQQWAAGMDTLVKFSPSFRKFLQGEVHWKSSNWVFDYYFVDHNDSKLTVWLSLLMPGLVRKTVTLQSPAK